MEQNQKEELLIEPLEGYEPEIGRYLWQLEDTRRRTKRALQNINPEVIDWTDDPNQNSIGTLLYHIAAIEIDWLYTEIMEQEFPPEVVELFPFDVRDEKGQLTVVRDISLEDHLKRLDKTRKILLDSFRGITIEEFRRLRILENYNVTPEWVLQHLMQHEAEHRGQMMILRGNAKRYSS